MSSESEAEAAFWAHAEKVQADYLSVPTPVRDTLVPYTDPQGLATRTARRPALWNGALCIML